MKPKTKTIVLQGPLAVSPDRAGQPSHYRVIKLTNSTEFSPREILTKAQTDVLCSAPDWHVTIEEKR